MKSSFKISLLLSLVTQIPFAIAMDNTSELQPLLATQNQPSDHTASYRRVHFARDPEVLGGQVSPNIPSGEQINTPPKTDPASSSNQNPFFKWYKKACEGNKIYKQTIKDFILNNKDIRIKGVSINPTRMALWAGIAGLSCLNWYGNKGTSEFDLGSLLLGHMAAELLETYPDPLRNHPIITPIATWCLTTFALAPLEFKFFYKNWKVLTGWPLVGEYTAYSTFTFKAIELLKWLKEGREEQEGSKLMQEDSQGNASTSNHSEASTSSTVSLRTIDSPKANVQNDVLEFKQTVFAQLKNRPNHAQVEALVARFIAQEMAKYAQASGSEQTTLLPNLRKRNIKSTSKDPLRGGNTQQASSFSLAPLMRVGSDEFPPDLTAIKLQKRSAQTPTTLLESGVVIETSQSAESSRSGSPLLKGNSSSSQ